jgi:hypothetical protein
VSGLQALDFDSLDVVDRKLVSRAIIGLGRPGRIVVREGPGVFERLSANSGPTESGPGFFQVPFGKRDPLGDVAAPGSTA